MAERHRVRFDGEHWVVERRASWFSRFFGIAEWRTSHHFFPSWRTAMVEACVRSDRLSNGRSDDWLVDRISRHVGWSGLPAYNEDSRPPATVELQLMEIEVEREKEIKLIGEQRGRVFRFGIVDGVEGPVCFPLDHGLDVHSQSESVTLYICDADMRPVVGAEIWHLDGDYAEMTIHPDEVGRWPVTVAFVVSPRGPKILDLG